jgi:hypothetical protein
MPLIERVFDENFGVWCVRKVWRQLLREGQQVARCTVARLMKSLGLQGVICGRPVRTTVSDRAAPCPLDHVNRQFMAPRPNALWVSDFTYVSTWAGFVYVAFVIDTYARRIVGWRVSRTAHAGFVLDALEQALHERRPLHGAGLVHHSDRGSQYVSIRYTERLAEAGLLAEELVVGALVGVLEAAPAADVVNQDELEIDAAGADVLEQPLQSLASTDVQPAFALIGVGVDDLDPMVLGIVFDTIGLVLGRILLMLG